MEPDEQRIDEAAMALLYLTMDKNRRAWKGVDWSVLRRLHEKAVIHDPIGKQKSVEFTPEGATEAKRLFEALFVKHRE